MAPVLSGACLVPHGVPFCEQLGSFSLVGPICEAWLTGRTLLVAIFVKGMTIKWVSGLTPTTGFQCWGLSGAATVKGSQPMGSIVANDCVGYIHFRGGYSKVPPSYYVTTAVVSLPRDHGSRGVGMYSYSRLHLDRGV